jgi:hypothetical protein
MLIPLTRKKLEELIPFAATGNQYRYCWGKPADFLRRLLISLVAVVVVFLISLVLPPALGLVEFMIGVIAGLYWLWSPVYWACRRNLAMRRYRYSGFWRGKVLDIFTTEEVVGRQETVDQRGDLVVKANRETFLNLEIGDETGFTTLVRSPFRKAYRGIRSGDLVEMLVLSNRPDLSRIAKITDVYLPDEGLWVSDYPYLQRTAFIETSEELSRRPSRSW